MFNQRRDGMNKLKRRLWSHDCNSSTRTLVLNHLQVIVQQLGNSVDHRCTANHSYTAIENQDHVTRTQKGPSPNTHVKSRLLDSRPPGTCLHWSGVTVITDECKPCWLQIPWNRRDTLLRYASTIWLSVQKYERTIKMSRSRLNMISIFTAKTAAINSKRGTVVRFKGATRPFAARRATWILPSRLIALK